MAYVLTSPCIGVKDGSCVDVCPVDSIHPNKDAVEYEQYDQIFIYSDECIDCGASESACPVAAIFEESAVQAHEREYILLNAAYFQQ